jgi:enamine deaminase RidA (YjgF/YER057c/UK114 family)
MQRTNPEQRLRNMGVELGPSSAPAGNYATGVRAGDLLFLSGKAPQAFKESIPKGRFGQEYTVEDGYEMARSACLDLLASIKGVLGDLSEVARIVELHGSLCTTADFEDHARVLDGASDLLVEVFGASGVHARSVIGVASLRNGIPLTLKATIECISDCSGPS